MDQKGHSNRGCDGGDEHFKVRQQPYRALKTVSLQPADVKCVVMQYQWRVMTSMVGAAQGRAVSTFDLLAVPCFRK